MGWNSKAQRTWRTILVLGLLLHYFLLGLLYAWPLRDSVTEYGIHWVLSQLAFAVLMTIALVVIKIMERERPHQ